MHIGKYVFAQITQFLPQRQFRRILAKYDDRTKGWTMSHWSHMLVLMFGQLIGCGTLRELTDITTAHGKKSKHLGFGDQPVNRQMLSKANLLRDHCIFEEFAFHMVAIAQSKRITKEFELHGRFYAIDSTTIDLCMSVFRWAEFRSTKSGSDKDYSAKQLAEDIGTNTRYISAVVNSRFHCNFTSLVNKYRIDDAMSILVDKRYQDLNVEEVGTMAGFSNRQSFYASFFRVLGMTPRDYRLQHLKQHPSMVSKRKK